MTLKPGDIVTLRWPNSDYRNITTGCEYQVHSIIVDEFYQELAGIRLYNNNGLLKEYSASDFKKVETQINLPEWF